MLSIHLPQSASDTDLISRPLPESLGINHNSTQSCLRLRQRGLQNLFQDRSRPQLQGCHLPELLFEDKSHQEKLMLIQKIGYHELEFKTKQHEICKCVVLVLTHTCLGLDSVLPCHGLGLDLVLTSDSLDTLWSWS